MGKRLFTRKFDCFTITQTTKRKNTIQSTPISILYLFYTVNTLKRMEWKRNILCPGLVYQNVEGLRKPGMLWGLLACFLPCVSIMVLRKGAKDQYGISRQGCCRLGPPTFYVGSMAEDATCLLCCTA